MPSRSRRHAPPSPSGAHAGSVRPRPGILAALAAVGAANAAWAGFLWRELLVARAGGDAFCALGGEGCELLWEGAFASAVQSATGVPVAGWGVVWGLAALALPAWAGLRAARGRSPEPAWSATGMTAAAGLVAVATLAAVSLSSGTLCGDCLLTYAGVAVYAGLAGLESWRIGAARPGRGALLAAGTAGAAFLLVLAPGLRTPLASQTLASQAAGGLASTQARQAEAVPPAREPRQEAGREPERLRERIEALSPRARQALADARALWLVTRPPREIEPRAPWGPAEAPVVLSVFTDSSCPHCARFHRALESLRRIAPEGSLAVDSRVFPLDGSCNPHLQGGGHPERCLATKVRLCLADDPRAEALEEALFARIGEFTEAAVWDVAEEFASRESLRACIDSPQTAARLREDIELAMATGIRGTPHVLLNGRPIPQNLDFVYAMAVTGGDARHPVFEILPDPRLGGVSAPGGRG